MKFNNDKTVSCEVEIKEVMPYASSDSCKKYLAIINGELKQVEYHCYEDENTKREEEYYIDEQGNIYEPNEIGKVYSVYCR